ncbi:hypothetical protein JWG45_12580 [Leptospira sp. 201903070]|jgi:hypothetical protein|uniref:Thioredoxin n=1 Tax=Leptospira ainlahdjerensis TaxID=2810033 RepID=A0ABS2UDY4_9LEPT|nr:hypothetical protein [Leptospira ainlahdjerensis]MBM9577984.1 hypothetical protein [Leptospira ainlahdjerensis]
MKKRKFQTSWKGIGTAALGLALASWLGFYLWTLFPTVTIDLWKQTSDSSVRKKAEKEGKLVLFLVEPKSCLDCEQVRKAFEGLSKIRNSYILYTIQEVEPNSRYEAILLDDRFEEFNSSLTDGKVVWGVLNSSDEILAVRTGTPGEKEESILLNLAEKNRFH